eukprot:XP_006584908.1 phosphoethanolamine N-methyltransferase [Glycine max]
MSTLKKEDIIPMTLKRIGRCSRMLDLMMSLLRIELIGSLKHTLQQELDALENKKGDFIRDFSEEDYNEIVERWKAKQTRGASREQMWGLFIAKKN